MEQRALAKALWPPTAWWALETDRRWSAWTKEGPAQEQENWGGGPFPPRPMGSTRQREDGICILRSLWLPEEHGQG